MIFLASKNFTKNYVNRHPSQLIYDTNLFDNNINLFNMFLTNFNSSVKFTVCLGSPSSEGLYHMETSLPTYHTNPWTGFCMVGDFSRGYCQTDCNFNFNVNVDSHMNSNFNFIF